MLKRALALVMVLSLALGAAAMAEENAFGWEVPEETLRIYIFYNASNFATGEEQDLGIENMKAYMLENFNVEYEVITTEGDTDEAFEAAWTDLQMAVESAGLETYAQYRAENYQHNLDLMAE